MKHVKRVIDPLIGRKFVGGKFRWLKIFLCKKICHEAIFSSLFTDEISTDKVFKFHLERDEKMARKSNLLSSKVIDENRSKSSKRKVFLYVVKGNIW